MNPTIHDVARLANTSKSTVSRFLNGQPVKKETEQALKKAIKELNYHRNVNARRLVMNKTQTIGIVVDDISNYFYTPVFKGIERIAKEKGFHCVFYSLTSNISEEISSLEFLYEGQVDGLIFVSFLKRKDEDLQKMAESGYPIVLVGHAGSLEVIDSVDVDNVYGITEMVKYLHRLGHRQIAYISGPDHLSATKDRLDGYEQTMAEFKLDVMVTHSDWSNQGGYLAMNQLFEMGDFTAIISSNDETAIGALKAIQERGYQVPIDFSLTGFDDIAISSWTYPSLTTLRQPFEAMGIKAAEILFNKIEKKQLSSKRHLLKPKLILRDSCRKI
ncbi:LacI family DNA-binding transcriptional regulator [uncultured Metabacillus sp.]|uniref:LacI family DNA-binding transcriptional regulator n=1 Tax=uncultured Metabacillus sp. TaxID=2860135 RepID=UPI002620EF10|nr:LacI family DNA-binding transcriptional regulator [uncultured Metabacillus sp.]